MALDPSKQIITIIKLHWLIGFVYNWMFFQTDIVKL